MTDIIIPCATVVRLAKVISGLGADIPLPFHSIRLDNGVAVVTNKRFMAVERIAPFEGIIHFIPNAALLAQCQLETVFNSTVTLIVNDLLRFAVAKTSLGYGDNTNVGLWPGACDFDRWREIIEAAKAPAKNSKRGMFWDVDGIAQLAASSPSGRVVFEANVDPTRPTVIRDVNDHNWFGIFNPNSSDDDYEPAKLPKWINP